MKYNYIRRLCSLRSSVFAMPLFILLLVLHSVAVSGQFLQQGAKLSGNDIHRPGNQGSAVALSADGNTAIVGGPYDGFTGAAWIFTRTGGVWSQEGLKLVGAGNAGFSSQGYSVGISADGNTAIVGGPDDDNMTGAAWIFTRSGGTWTQHGTKLVGQGAIGAAAQGVSVGISADGQTAVIGGSADNYNEGAVWVFARTGDSWLQQGPKLVGSGGYEAIQGFAVSISGDGNTIVVGGPNDYFYTGAAWVFKRSGGIWTQHGDKLLVSGAVEDVGLQAGRAVSIAADGNTIILGGPWDDYWTGAAWIFTLEGNEWLQQGSKLVGSGATEDPFQGYGVSLSADGNTAVIGGPYDENYLGSSWIFRRNGGIWTQQGNKLSGTGTAENPGGS